MVKELVSGKEGVLEGSVFDDIQISKVLIITKDMEKRYQTYGKSSVMMIDTHFSNKFIENYFLIMSGVCTATAEIKVFGILITDKNIESLKRGFNWFLKVHSYEQPKSLIIDSDPFILEACKQTFSS